MSWVIIIDNNQDYSDHSHQVIAVCKTESEAKSAIEAFDKWKAKLEAELPEPYYIDEEERELFLKANPCPFSKITFTWREDWCLRSSDSVFCVEVPVWARGRA